MWTYNQFYVWKSSQRASWLSAISLRDLARVLLLYHVVRNRHLYAKSSSYLAHNMRDLEQLLCLCMGPRCGEQVTVLWKEEHLQLHFRPPLCVLGWVNHSCCCDNAKPHFHDRGWTICQVSFSIVATAWWN